MEKQTIEKALTKAENVGVTLNQAEAEEFRDFQKRKRMSEIYRLTSAMEAELGDTDDMQRVCERARRLKQSAVRLPLTKMAQAKYYLAGSNVALDCVVGGTGETLTKVKAYEARLALKNGAKELTVRIAPSFIDGCRFAEIKKELKRIRRLAGKKLWKVAVEKSEVSTSLVRVARIASEVGAAYFCVPYFTGCERLRLELTGKCRLQVSGVTSAQVCNKLFSFGVGRVVTSQAWEIYNEWLADMQKPKTAVERVTTKIEKRIDKTANDETDYQCKLEGNKLMFY